MPVHRFALLAALVFASPALADDPLPRGAVARLGSPRWRLLDRLCTPRVEYTPDGKFIVCLNYERSIVWVDVETGRVVKRVRGPALFTDFCLTPDGKTLLTADVPTPLTMAGPPPDPLDPRGVRAWEVSGAPKQMWFLENESGRLAANARHVAMASERGLSLIEVRIGTAVWSKPYDDVVRGTFLHAVSPDGKSVIAFAFTAGEPIRPVYAWDVATGERRKLAEPDAPHSGYAISPDGLAVASFGHETVVRRWDLRTGKALPPLAGHTNGAVEAATFSRDSRIVVSSGIDHTIRWWDHATGKELGRIETAAVAAHLWLSPDGKTLAAVCYGEDVLRRFDLTTNRELPTPDGHAAEVTFLAFTADGKSLVTAAEDDAVRVWDPATGKERRRFPPRTFDKFRTVAMSPDGRLLANANGLSDDPVRLWDLTTGQAVREIAVAKGAVESLAFTPDGKALATHRSPVQPPNPSLRLWDLAGKELWRADAPRLAANGLRFSADGKRLWAATLTPGLYAWEVVSGRAIGRTEDVLTTIAVSPNGRMLAGRAGTDTGDSEIRLIETATGKPRLRFGRTPHLADLSRAAPLAFSPDGRTVAAVVGTAVVLWDAGTGRELRRFEGHERRVRAVAFSPDGKLLGTGSEDSTIVLWDLIAVEK